jgi:3-hydroxyisobutyrate dehydrogenase-like beta-hydroxyacid dehydrogenase
MTTASILRVACVGTGIMGGHLARRLANAGFEVVGWNRTESKAAALRDAGVRVAASVGEALADADAVVVMLSSGPVVDAVLFGIDPAGPDASAVGPAAIAGLRAGALLIVMSSIPVETARAQAAMSARLGLRYLDAPVSGGEPGARDGTLAILVGGEAAAFVAAAPLFAVLGRATHLGPAGSGQLAKLANQVIVGGTLVAIAEALTLARAGGADPVALREALMGGFGDSKVLRVLGERMVHGDFEPGSPAAHQLKDLRTAAAVAEAGGLRLRLLTQLVETFESLVAHGDGARDVGIVLREVERQARVAPVPAGRLTNPVEGSKRPSDPSK